MSVDFTPLWDVSLTLKGVKSRTLYNARKSRAKFCWWVGHPRTRKLSASEGFALLTSWSGSMLWTPQRALTRHPTIISGSAPFCAHNGVTFLSHPQQCSNIHRLWILRNTLNRNGSLNQKANLTLQWELQAKMSKTTAKDTVPLKHRQQQLKHRLQLEFNAWPVQRMLNDVTKSTARLDTRCTRVQVQGVPKNGPPGLLWR